MAKITTVLMDYDGTLHDWDSVLKRNLDGIFDLNGETFYNIWTYKIHRAIIHKNYIDRHDDVHFHCELLFKHLNIEYNSEDVANICSIFEEASEIARKQPIYFPDSIPALEKLKEMSLKICLSTGKDAETKAETMHKATGKRFFDYIFSEPLLGNLKTEPEYYLAALLRAKAQPSETISIGDTPLSDIKPAKLVDIKTIWLNRDDELEPPTGDQIADYQVSTLLEAVKIIKSVNEE
jgi:putative hydrolase of the HAD superfamily